MEQFLPDALERSSVQSGLATIRRDHREADFESGWFRDGKMRADVSIPDDGDGRELALNEENPGVIRSTARRFYPGKVEELA